MTLLIGFLTFVLVMNCLFLILLILIQLPKKEAGAGIAFGGAATDALFGAGSGNALTNITKYSASIFLALTVLLSMLNMHAARQSTSILEQEISKQANTPGASAVPAVPNRTLDLPVSSNGAAPTTSSAPSSSLLTIPATNAATVTPAPTAPAATTPAPANPLAEQPAPATTPAPVVPPPTAPTPTPAK